MEFRKAKDKALEIGRGLLRRARGENESEEDEVDHERRNPKYLSKKKEDVQISQKSNVSVVRDKSFSPVEVSNLVAKARVMMRKEVDKRAEAEGGWRVVDGEEARRKGMMVAREMLDKELAEGARGEICWQCNERGHTSRRCPLGVLCFYCRKIGHQKADCLELRRRMGDGMNYEAHSTSGLAQGGVRIIKGEGSSSRGEAKKDLIKEAEHGSKGEKLKMVEKHAGEK